MYQSFMAGYVRRINEATLNVTIGGVRIGQAKYTRLAQINLKSRIITFSRYAIENVPERGRRYLVIHELAHVKEPSHNKRFWEFVGEFEPNYKQIGKELELAFRRNVKEEQLIAGKLKVENPVSGRMEEPKLLLFGGLIKATEQTQSGEELFDFDPEHDSEHEIDGESFDCMDDEFGLHDGIMHGGSEVPLVTS